MSDLLFEDGYSASFLEPYNSSKEEDEYQNLIGLNAKNRKVKIVCIVYEGKE